ncbi:hypothetical protein Pse7367_0300 [Thalassoporum mexicanum PCC 7367]|uniref:hypothetical protein n=1 Tax=Thalassoporum mexicanum TaxID=3457544 RepID=UPI00029F97EB|nr:hypothetical protein [Pseudanabaena sp. PCC 7367]AFY68614.1 hypothetical protein Pse7367_0300 [Pseudanabaena sp. PCC 7367]
MNTKQNIVLDRLLGTLDFPKLIVEEIERVWHKKLSGAVLEPSEAKLFETIEDYLDSQIIDQVPA